VPEFSLPPVEGRSLGLSSADPSTAADLGHRFAKSSSKPS